MGLSIVKQIIVRLAGTVGFEPAPGGGTVFHVELPCCEPSGLPALHMQAGGTQVLLCEDDREVAAIVRDRLQSAGFTTDVARTAAEAVKNAANVRYAAILVDLQLPDSDGINLIKQLRAQPQYHNTPIVVVSADPERGRGDARSSSLNVLEWLPKPVDIERLLNVLDRPIVRAANKRPCILHLDDDHDVLHAVARALAPTAEVVSVDSIEAARRALSTRHFDLAVLDIALADGLGLDLLPDLCGRDGQPIPVVVFSAQDNRKIAARVLASLTKSRVSMDSLVAMLHRLVGHKSVDINRPRRSHDRASYSPRR